MKLAVLRCRVCGRERPLHMRERGTTVACICGESMEVPQNLEFPEYYEVYRDRVLAQKLEVVVGLAFLLCCLPASATVWWLASGAIQRARDEERLVDPVLARVRLAARLSTVLQGVVWCGLALRR